MENTLKNINLIVKDRSLSVGAKALFFYILNIGNTEYPDRNKIAFDLNISNCTPGFRNVIFDLPYSMQIF